MRPKWLSRGWPWADRHDRDDPDDLREPLPAEMAEEPDDIADTGSDRDAWWNRE